MHNLAQSRLDVIKPSRSVNARKTSQMLSNREEFAGAEFLEDRF